MDDRRQRWSPVQRHDRVHCEGDALTPFAGDSGIVLTAIAARASALAAIVVMTGAVAFRFGVLQRLDGPPSELLRRWNSLVAQSGAWAATCVLLVAPIRLWTQARGLVMPGDPVSPMMRNVLQTMWGYGWLAQAVAASLLLAGFLLADRGVSAGWWLALVSVLGLTISPALMGHAIAAGHFLIASLLADWLHVAMAGAWVGALAMLTAIVRSLNLSDSGGDASAARLIELFHPLALTGATVLTATGVVSLFLRVEHISDLWQSAYGGIVAVKLVLTLGVATLGWHHSRRAVRPAQMGSAGALRRSLTAETALAAAVIAVTAVLVGTAPPMR